MQPHLFIVLAVIQAATEFLPVSSSGHLLFIKGLWGGQQEIPLIVDVLMHVGSLTAILFYYRRRIGSDLLEGWSELRSRNFRGASLRFLLFVGISTIVTGGMYGLLHGFLERGFRSPSLLPWTFGFTTLLLGATFLRRKNGGLPLSAASWWMPVLAGVFQGIALFPGISRSGSTIAVLLFLGISRVEAGYYSFFMAIPAIFGAMVIKSLELTTLHYLERHTAVLALAFLVSAAGSYLFLGVLNWLLKRGRLWCFAGYTLVMTVLTAVLFRGAL